ncbi:hypothetical protein BLOT_015339 [Blomia tropicalis]|nr:hypothetical protein BLOT_015339 [Blomia tropicalis]
MPSCWLFSDLGLRRCRAGSFVGSLNGWMAITVDWLKGCNGENKEEELCQKNNNKLCWEFQIVSNNRKR